MSHGWLLDKLYYRMAKIYCHIHINQCDASVQYFTIPHAVRETHNTKNTFTLAFVSKIKHCSRMRQSLRQKYLSRDICQLSCDRIIVQCGNYCRTEKILYIILINPAVINRIDDICLKQSSRNRARKVSVTLQLVNDNWRSSESSG